MDILVSILLGVLILLFVRSVCKYYVYKALSDILIDIKIDLEEKE